MLKGVEADGNCFFNAFLKSYETLRRKIPLLDIEQDKVNFLREQVASSTTDPVRAQEIKRNTEWVTALGEGEVLAKVLSIPLRLLTVDTVDVSDILIFPELNKENHEWNTLNEEDKPLEYIFIVDLGGHFIFASRSVYP